MSSLNFGVKVGEISFVPSVHEFHKTLKIIAILNNEWLKLHVARSCSRYAVLVCNTAQFNGEVKILFEFLLGDFHTNQNVRVFINVQKKREVFMPLSSFYENNTYLKFLDFSQIPYFVQC